MAKTPLTLVVITKNEEAVIEKCLKSAHWVDHIVVVDSGSTDKTMEIAKACGATVFQQEWLGFGPQKRFGSAQAPTDWVLSLDADEFLSPQLSMALQELMQQGPTASAYQFARTNKFLGKFLYHGEGYPDWSLRLFDKRKADWSNDAVHEKVQALNGALDVQTVKGDLMHESGESISRYIEKQNRYTDLQAQALVNSGKKIGALNVLFSPLVRFLRFYFVKAGFLDGFAGFVHISIGCFFAGLKYVKAMALKS